jgi:hypothetical protein
MRLILHPKVYSDIDEIMQYYERIAKPELAHEFYAELRYLMTKAGTRHYRPQSGSRICGELTSDDSLTTFCFASSTTSFES